jgi:outer membrane protein assembly factor BamB
MDRELEASHESRVTALSLTTGKELWSKAPQVARDGYSTPVVYDDGKRKLLITLTAHTLVAYNVVTGETAWEVKIPIGQPVASVLIAEHTLFVTGGGGGQGYTAAYQLRPGDVPTERWTSRQSSARVSSPVLYKGRLFTISDTGVMVCYDASSGKVMWRQRIGSGSLGVFYASLVAADDKIYATRSNGTTYVVAVDDRFRLISESTLPEEIFASAAFGAGCLLLRTDVAVYCIAGTE